MLSDTTQFVDARGEGKVDADQNQFATEQCG